MAEKTRPQCFFDLEINREPIGRIVFQLFSDVCPKTCTNFLCLCTGEKGTGKVTGKKLWYKGSTFHRVVKSFMIQGGDFSEGNGKGGESVFGGYFRDENFILKHDRAFLLSMANRGKHTNGSQFFITTKPAPHLDGVHVVFGLVISGFEVIEQIESLKTDAASRPYADVRVIDCGILGAKSTKNEKPKAMISQSEELDSSSKSSSPSSSSESFSSESEAQLERNKKRKRKRKTKVKHAKRKRKEGRRDVEEEKQVPLGAHSEKNSTAEDKDSGTKRDKPVVRPEEIPPIPENRFLLRKDAPMSISEPEQKPPAIAETNDQAKGSITKSGRKIRGRGTIRYHTPPLSRSQSESSGDRESSETPPHWKEEMQRLKSYKPPSVEKWSKGDKLNERLPSRWDEGSLSPRSISNSWSHDGYHSESSKEPASRSKSRKKDKKLKHKKKSKKVKNSKKHKKKEEFSASLREESSSRRKKYSQEQTQRSSSRSSRDSSKRGLSQFDKEQKSSRHSSNSQSRSRSNSRGSERSRTASRSTSRSRTRSRSHTESKSRNRNLSGSHSNSYSHSSKQTKTSSASPPKKDLAASKSGAGGQPGKSVVMSNNKSTDDSLMAFVTNENVHVISLSDSPPPSRWKPGQKPWKPSYERIQEMKANASNVLPTQRKYGSSKVKSGSRRKRHSSSESEHSDYSDRSSSYPHKSKDRSSSRSFSRSYTRSRSGSSSSSHAERAASSSYDSSSSSGSNNEEERNRKTRTKVKNKRHKAKGKVENSVSPKSMGSRSNSNSSSSSEGEEFTKRLLKTTKALLENHNSNSSKEEVEKSAEESNTDGQNSKSDKDGTQDVISNIDKVLESDKLKETVGKLLDDNSICNSQITNAIEEVASSGKEEGEASSESDSEEVNLSKTPPSEASQQASEKPSKSPPSETSSPEPKSKSKKHKRRSGKKSVKKSRSKSKVKDKSQKNKEKKQKSQKKQQQTFHWQPPLEFGEEEEEEEITGGGADVQMKGNTPKGLLLNKPSSAESRTATNASLLIDKISAEPKIVSLTSAVKTEDAKTLLKVTKSPLTSANLEPTSDSIKAFTCHRSLPQLKLGTNSTGGTAGGTTTGNSDKISSPSVSATPVESMQVKEEKTQDAQLASNNTSTEKVEAAASETAVVDNKWKPVQGPTILQTAKPTVESMVTPAELEKKTQGLRIEIKSKNKVKPGSLFDEVRKTARLNQRPRNQESSSEERSSSPEEKSPSNSKARSRSKTPSSHRSRTQSSSRSRSRSVQYSSSSRSRSYTRSRSRRRYNDYRSRTRSRSYGSYRSYSRSRSRSASYERHRRRSRSRSYDSYGSRSRSRSPSHYRSRSYKRRSRSRRSSYSGSDHSYGHNRRHSGRS